MTKKIGYKLNPNKLKKAPQSILPYVVGAFYYTEDYEYFTFGSGYLRYYKRDKPSAIVRFFMKTLLDFRWVDV
jgi:hypothetical protein